MSAMVVVAVDSSFVRDALPALHSYSSAVSDNLNTTTVSVSSCLSSQRDGPYLRGGHDDDAVAASGFSSSAWRAKLRDHHPPLIIRECGGGGNCLYCVVAYFAFGDALKHDEVRAAIVSELLGSGSTRAVASALLHLDINLFNHPYEPPNNAPIDNRYDYAHHIAHHAGFLPVWGCSNIDLSIASAMYGCDFKILIAPYSVAILGMVTPNDDWRRSGTPNAKVCHVGANGHHYVALDTLPDNNNIGKAKANGVCLYGQCDQRSQHWSSMPANNQNDYCCQDHYANDRSSVVEALTSRQCLHQGCSAPLAAADVGLSPLTFNSSCFCSHKCDVAVHAQIAERELVRRNNNMKASSIAAAAPIVHCRSCFKSDCKCGATDSDADATGLSPHELTLRTRIATLQLLIAQCAAESAHLTSCLAKSIRDREPASASIVSARTVCVVADCQRSVAVDSIGVGVVTESVDSNFDRAKYCSISCSEQHTRMLLELLENNDECDDESEDASTYMPTPLLIRTTSENALMSAHMLANSSSSSSSSPSAAPSSLSSSTLTSTNAEFDRLNLVDIWTLANGAHRDADSSTNGEHAIASDAHQEAATRVNGWATPSYIKWYQLQALKWIVERELANVNRCGVYADAMGIGKTLVMLSAIRANEKSNDKHAPVARYSRYIDDAKTKSTRAAPSAHPPSTFVSSLRPLRACPATLLLVPRHLVANWLMEAWKHFGELNNGNSNGNGSNTRSFRIAELRYVEVVRNDQHMYQDTGRPTKKKGVIMTPKLFEYSVEVQAQSSSSSSSSSSSAVHAASSSSSSVHAASSSSLDDDDDDPLLCPLLNHFASSHGFTLSCVEHSAIDVDNYDIIIVGFQHLKTQLHNVGELHNDGRYIRLIADVHWWRIIIDECQELGKKTMLATIVNDISSSQRWLVSGTPFNVGKSKTRGGQYRSFGNVLTNLIKWTDTSTDTQAQVQANTSDIAGVGSTDVGILMNSALQCVTSNNVRNVLWRSTEHWDAHTDTTHVVLLYAMDEASAFAYNRRKAGTDMRRVTEGDDDKMDKQGREHAQKAYMMKAIMHPALGRLAKSDAASETGSIDSKLTMRYWLMRQLHDMKVAAEVCESAMLIQSVEQMRTRISGAIELTVEGMQEVLKYCGGLLTGGSQEADVNIPSSSSSSSSALPSLLPYRGLGSLSSLLVLDNEQQKMFDDVLHERRGINGHRVLTISPTHRWRILEIMMMAYKFIGDTASSSSPSLAQRMLTIAVARVNAANDESIRHHHDESANAHRRQFDLAVARSAEAEGLAIASDNGRHNIMMYDIDAADAADGTTTWLNTVLPVDSDANRASSLLLLANVIECLPTNKSQPASSNERQRFDGRMFNSGTPTVIDVDIDIDLDDKTAPLASVRLIVIALMTKMRQAMRQIREDQDWKDIMMALNDDNEDAKYNVKMGWAAQCNKCPKCVAPLFTSSSPSSASPAALCLVHRLDVLMIVALRHLCSWRAKDGAASFAVLDEHSPMRKMIAQVRHAITDKSINVKRAIEQDLKIIATMQTTLKAMHTMLATLIEGMQPYRDHQAFVTSCRTVDVVSVAKATISNKPIGVLAPSIAAYVANLDAIRDRIVFIDNHCLRGDASNSDDMSCVECATSLFAHSPAASASGRTLHSRASLLRCGCAFHPACLDERRQEQQQQSIMPTCPKCNTASRLDKSITVPCAWFGGKKGHQLTMSAAFGTMITYIQGITRNVDLRKEKFIIYSSHDDALDLIESLLRSVSISFVRPKFALPVLSSSGPSAAAAAINLFNDDTGVASISVLLLNTCATNSGLNLQAANHVIFVDPVPDINMNRQAIARVQRQGQTRPVSVVYLLAKDEGSEQRELYKSMAREFALDTKYSVYNLPISPNDYSSCPPDASALACAEYWHRRHRIGASMSSMDADDAKAKAKQADVLQRGAHSAGEVLCAAAAKKAKEVYHEAIQTVEEKQREAIVTAKSHKAAISEAWITFELASAGCENEYQQQYYDVHVLAELNKYVTTEQ